MTLSFTVDGAAVEVDDNGGSLLDVLREQLEVRSAKDGCSPQGQCGCCTVLVDGQPRVACVTPARRVAGRAVTTLDGMSPELIERWVDAFVACGASQCGFCTPGILVRLASLADPRPEKVEQALLAHLCRCTGWGTIVEAAALASSDATIELPDRTDDAADRRAAIEGHAPQRTGRDVVRGRGGFADDTAPERALVAVPSSNVAGEWAVGETLAEARQLAGKVQGRRTTIDVRHPLDVPPGDWDLTLRTTWVEPAYLEPDASWCAPGQEPYTALANGGAFGGKVDTLVGEVARRLAVEHGRAVRVVLAREDVVRLGPKRPPIAAGLLRDGTGVIRVVRTAGIAAAIRSVLPNVDIEEVDVAGPRTSTDLRAAGWAEAAVLLAALRGDATVEAPNGALATAAISDDGSVVSIKVRCGAPLDGVVLRSYCIGAAHMALGWVRSEGIAVDDTGAVHDLTIRSFGILRAKDTPAIDVQVEDDTGPPINGSDAVFAAVAAAAWLREGLHQDWPTLTEER